MQWWWTHYFEIQESRTQLYTAEFRVKRVIAGTKREAGTETEHENEQIGMIGWTAKKRLNHF